MATGARRGLQFRICQRICQKAGRSPYSEDATRSLTDRSRQTDCKCVVHLLIGRQTIMRKPVIAGNWKMYKLIGDAVATVTALKPLVANANHCEVVVAPPY